MSEPSAFKAAARYLRGEISYEELKEVEAAADPLESAAWLAQRQTRRVIDLAEAIRQRDESRAILAPLLDDPIIFDAEDGYNCVFCIGHGQEWSWIEPTQHRPDCPVLRRDAVLGRDRAPVPPEGGAP